MENTKALYAIYYDPLRSHILPLIDPKNPNPGKRASAPGTPREGAAVHWQKPRKTRTPSFSEHLYIFQASPQPPSETAILPTMFFNFRSPNYVHTCPDDAYMRTSLGPAPPSNSQEQYPSPLPFKFEESQLDPILRSPMVRGREYSDPPNMHSTPPQTFSKVDIVWAVLADLNRAGITPIEMLLLILDPANLQLSDARDEFYDHKNHGRIHALVTDIHHNTKIRQMFKAPMVGSTFSCAGMKENAKPLVE